MVRPTRLEKSPVAAIFATKRQWFCPKVRCLKGLAMLIRGEIIEVQGQAAIAAAPDAILPAPLPTLILGEILLLIGP
jgi:hypothetical protein